MTVTGQVAAAPDADAGEGGRVGQWIRSDPVRAVAIALIVLQLAWRPQIAGGGFLAVDDYALESQAAGSHLTFRFLGSMFNNHLMPGGMLVSWLVTRGAGLEYWPYVILLTAGQAAVSIAFYRLLRRLLPAGWGQLVPLVLFLFSPLTLEATSWWVAGVNLLPMQLAMVLAVGAQVRYVHTGRARHLVTLGLSLVLGLLFFEKSVLIAPLLFVLTACLYSGGGPVRATLRTLTRYWRAWLVLFVICAGYLALYLTRAQSSVHRPSSPTEPISFVRQLLFSTLIPGLFGGPWRWLSAEDGAPITATGEIPRWLALAGFVALVVLTVLARRVALRAWLVLLVYTAMVAVLLAATRLGQFYSAAAGLAPRYVGDVLVVAALCLGVALLGLRDPAPSLPWSAAPARMAGWPAPVRTREGVAVALVVTLGGYLLGAAWSGARFADDWKVKTGRDYLRTVQAELATAPPGTVFFDQPVPAGVLRGLSWPYNLQSEFFRPLSQRPEFVTEAEDPMVIDDLGRFQHAQVVGVDIKPSADQGCGYKLDRGRAVAIPLTGNLIEWAWVVHFGYLSSGDSDALLRLGDGQHWFQVHRGLHEIFFLMSGVGDTVELTVQNPAVTVCTKAITIGKLAPHS